MAKKKTTIRIEEMLLDEAKRQNINVTQVSENALAERLGYKIERGTKLIKLLQSS
jgi:hypothetical protein